MARMKYSKAEKLAILALYKDGHHLIADITGYRRGKCENWICFLFKITIYIA
ncbi:hypothetical protein [Bacillus thuringiensis]|uniref:hypothetical protein n=1 Tax=Bacillus thuringiensis TaxID=1428 RepID=UPI00211D255D|nr:hypothetical protein [Bacillus thuringiensis]